MRSDRVLKSFDRASQSYHDMSHIQRAMASDLFALFDTKRYGCILECGCGTGNLTELIVTRALYKSIYINDISVSMTDICQNRFHFCTVLKALVCDFRVIDMPSYFDLIASNAVLQWCDNLYEALLHLKVLLKKDGELIFSTFGPENFIEFKKSGAAGLEYAASQDIKKMLESLGFKVYLQEKLFKEHFRSTRDLLLSLKKTGVCAVGSRPMSAAQFRDFVRRYERSFTDENGVYVTWHQYFVKAVL